MREEMAAKDGTIIQRLIESVQKRISEGSRFTDELFTDPRYVFGNERQCHDLTVELIQAAAKHLKEVASVSGNKLIQKGMRPQWRPDVVLWDAQGTPMTVVPTFREWARGFSLALFSL